MSIETSCAFTGHRPQHFAFGYDEENPNCLALKQAIGSAIGALLQQGVTTYYTGMALGVDIWAAEIVLSMKIAHPELKLVAVRPCDTQANRWSPEQQYRYYSILECVDSTFLLRPEYTRECMLERNRFMVDRARHLLAVYDGGQRGGTAYTVRYANQQGRVVHTIPPARFKAVVQDENEDVQKRRDSFRVIEKDT